MKREGGWGKRAQKPRGLGPGGGEGARQGPPNLGKRPRGEGGPRFWGGKMGQWPIGEKKREKKKKKEMNFFPGFKNCLCSIFNWLKKFFRAQNY